MDTATIEKVLGILKREIHRWKVPAVGVVAHQATDRPFETLVSTILSLRTKDAVTGQASRRLLSRASTPAALALLTARQIEELIYPVGFYRTKARNLIETSRIILRDYDAKVPRDMDALLRLPGVGRKTANLVLTVGYDEYGICVDTHVHRISNRLGLVATRGPDETEAALRERLPRSLWWGYNELLVSFGKSVCTPLSPRCSICPVARGCPRVGVGRSR